MQQVIEEVPASLIEAELTPERFLRNSNRGNTVLYVVSAAEAPHTMQEIGRLRELAFRDGGGGTGKACDIDEFDTAPGGCRQLVVWDPAARRIVGGYRFIFGPDIRLKPDGQPDIATSHIFRFSDEFIRDYLPHTIELGRSFVRVENQATRRSSVAIYALDNLWDGLGALLVDNPDIKYLFGKMTMYPEYDPECRDMILYFLHKHFPDHKGLVVPTAPLLSVPDVGRLGELFPESNDFKEDYKALNTMIRRAGLNIPPLVNAYMGLSPTMRCFGTSINDEFGNVEETGIMINIDEIREEKKQRHMATYISQNPILP